jgi:NAD(P)H dehydrogenase (quinone)
MLRPSRIRKMKLDSVGVVVMARVAIFVGHARMGSYCEALGEAYRRGAEAAGHEAGLFVNSRMRFDPVLHEGFERVPWSRT